MTGSGKYNVGKSLGSGERWGEGANALGALVCGVYTPNSGLGVRRSTTGGEGDREGEEEKVKLGVKSESDGDPFRVYMPYRGS